MRHYPVLLSKGVLLCTGVLCFIIAGDSTRAGTDTATNIATSLQGEPAQLTLAEAQRQAVQRNWDLLAAAAGVDAANAQKILGAAFPNPTLSFSSSLINFDHRPSSTSEGNGIWERSYDTVIAINQLFEIGGKRRNRKASAQAGLEGAKAQFQDAQRTLELAVMKAYVAAVQAEENVRVLTKSAASLRQEAGLAEVRMRAGEISGSDKSQIEISAERLELDAKSAESAAAQARVALEVLIGNGHPTGNIALSDSLDFLCEQTPPTAAGRSVLSRPDIVAASAALKKAEADLRLQRANRIPDPTVLAQYEHEPDSNPNSAGFGVSFPLPIWNRNRGGILAAEAAREQARLALEKAEAQAYADVATAQFSYEDAIQRWRRYHNNLRPQSEEIRKTIAYAYEKGGASLLDLLAAERNDNEVRLATAQAASDAAVALASLKAATREISKTNDK